MVKKKKKNEAPEVVEKKEPINNKDLVERFRAEGGRILHIRPEGVYNARGITFAYKAKGGRVEVASAVTHRSDSFTKKIGTKTAIEHFDQGKFIVLPLGTKRHPDALLKHMGFQFSFSNPY